MDKQCGTCGEPSSPSTELKPCSRCKKNWYCSLDCEKIHWEKGCEVQGATPSIETNELTSTPINICPICLSMVDNFGDPSQCCNCGQLFCGGCKIKLEVKCPSCLAPFTVTPKEHFDRLYSLVHDRPDDLHTRYACYGLGIAYENGRGVDQDLALAAKYFKLAADEGHHNAQYNLGVAYVNGKGVQKDITEAAKYFKLAAEQGDKGAITTLGLIFIVGTRVQVTGLTSDAALNGATGAVTETLGNGSAAVMLDGETKPRSIPFLDLNPL